METLHALQAIYSSVILLDLPIRDGNFARYRHADAPSFLLDLPIRDGNLISYTSSSVVAVTFRPSYQGWKPTLENYFRIGEVTFRPSYQGWKHKALGKA